MGFVKKSKVRDEKQEVSFFRIFRYADWKDVLLMLFGTLGAIGDGMSTNCLLVFASDLMNTLGYSPSKQDTDFMSKVEKFSLYFVYLGLVVWALAFTEGYCWSRTSERQVMRTRYKYLEAVLKQEVSFFESQEASVSEIIESVSKDAALMQEVLSDKVPLFILRLSEFVSGLAFAFYFSWRLSLVALPLITLLVIPGLIYGKYLLHLSRKSTAEYGNANAIVERALCSIRTIYSFTLENRTIERYSSILNKTVKIGLRQGLAKGLAVGSNGVTFAIWGFMAWYGSKLVMYKGETGGRIYASGICFILGGLSLGLAIPDIKYFTEAAVAATRISQRINRTPQIDADDTSGIVPGTIQGKLELQDVRFSYPTRPESTVLKGFSLTVPAGNTVALVGTSGCGKSTMIALLQRFYDVQHGEVRIDDINIKRLQLKWIRSKMGLVSQDHALFGTSIKENILFGKPDATNDEVYAAAMAANAHNFIVQLPHGYDTMIGERGSQLSGGQKQRIVIARALIKNPPILLLDEATAALDSESEKMVQSALDQASMGRTTIVVSHKLSTINCSDQIAVVDSGRVVEIGCHSELIKRPNGTYARLAKLQRQFSSNDQEQDVSVSSVTRSSGGRCSFDSSNPYSMISELSEHDQSELEHKPPPTFARLLKLSYPEWKQGLVASLSAIVSGAVQPVYALTVGSMIAAFFVPSHQEMKSLVRHYSLAFFFLSLISMMVSTSQHYLFSEVGEKLTRRIRVSLLSKILTFEIGWFDEEQNSSAALCSTLSKDASTVKSLVADRVSLLVHTISAVTIAIVMGLIVAWKLALVIIATQPLTILCFYTRTVMLSKLSSDSIKSQKQSTQIAAEAIHNHRIITSYSAVDKVVFQLYDQSQTLPKRTARRKSWMAGVALGTAQSLTFITWALDFWFGGKLVMSGAITPGAVFKTFFILVRTGKVIAEAGSMTSDLANGSVAVASVFQILNRPTQIPSAGKKGLKLPDIQGTIELKDVGFAYPVRPKNPVLVGFNLRVKCGKSVGLVGKSGCGKSTVLGLVQRFYDVSSGSVRVDGVDIRELDLPWFRRFTSIVSQEPVLYSGSIRDNILIGKPDANENEIVDAAMAANAHSFICSLKDGYETECGERGVQLSGGQRQRISIARAIIRSPAILLLDEATSALDAKSEQVVQEALDRIMKGRTSIIVAHRLNTIKNVDSIAVVADGKVVEHGSHAELRSEKGVFFELSRLQS
ncbi:unnamed protein product [Victoria cruziana]